jgi:hypothetical protein
MLFSIKFLCVLTIGLCISHILCEDEQSAHEVDDTATITTYRYLSELQSEYFTKLPKWWLTVGQIDGDRALKDFMKDVINEHREYTFKASKEQVKFSYYRTYLLLDIEYFNGNITALYNTLKEDTTFLYDEKVPEGNQFDVSQLSTWAQSDKTLKLKEHLQALFDITLQPNVVYKHIQKVCR